MPRGKARAPVWLFDLDDTLHDASNAAFAGISASMTAFIERELALSRTEAEALRGHYWRRYGATLIGLVRHHGIQSAHFLHDTHALPGLESRLRSHPHDLAALARLPGRKFILTNAPRVYAERVLDALGLWRHFDGVITIEQMAMFGHLRPKPDARMLRHIAVRLQVPAHRCVLVEDTLEHQKAARRVGMRTVWMQRWLGGSSTASPGRRPVYVCARIRSLQALAGWR
jgi:putative hydrolase of the HAD superfamily